ncbi:hypothetical protein ACFL45_01105 [Candidatus Neomarinimicrobiota bacterium]
MHPPEKWKPFPAGEGFLLFGPVKRQGEGGINLPRWKELPISGGATFLIFISKAVSEGTGTICAYETDGMAKHKNGWKRVRHFMYSGAKKGTLKGLFQASEALKVLLQGTAK